MHRPCRVLFVCTHNSARSPTAEAVLRHLTRGRFEVASAGLTPAPRVHAMALLALGKLGIDATGLRPKSLDEFAPHQLDYVVTVCDDAREQCPVVPGPAARLHWNCPDPTRVAGTEPDRQRAFDRVATELMTRSRLWLSLPEMAARLGLTI
ncbi:MAG: arsenate reductase ArsC [Vicinamibacterales bacterium]